MSVQEIHEAACCSLNFYLFIPSSSADHGKANREFSHFECPKNREAGHPHRAPPPNLVATQEKPITKQEDVQLAYGSRFSAALRKSLRLASI